MAKRGIWVSAILLAFVFVLLCSCEPSRDKHFSSIVGDEITDEEYAVLRDTENYKYSDHAPKEFTLTDQPVLRYFPFLYPQQMAQSPADFSNDAFLWKHYYLIFDKNPILLKLSTTDPVSVFVGYIDTDLPFIRDLLNVREEMTILDTRCTLQNIVLSNSCDPAPSNGVILYYETDQGVFVRYYRSESSSGEWFALQTFTGYAQRYVQYLQDNAYNENGEPLIGQMTFRAYLDVIRTEEP